ncbi:MAG TPA: DUF401 family protein [Bacillota bacterium]|nr:DUF401 family protein [Bacillota bacterium]HPT87680.1 DUF401 family protein [Bacillota bacterium]
MFHPGINLILVLGLIVILIRCGIQLGWTMGLAGIVLGLLFKVSAAGFWDTLTAAVLSRTFLQLGIALNMIMFLENILRKKGYLSRITRSLRHLIPNSKINIMLLPAFLGLLPSPGGAMFSAPLVTEAGHDLEMSAETKSMVNYWFRHIWEYSIPLYPGIILGSQILKVPIGRITLIMAAFSLLSVIIGYFLIIRPIKPLESVTPMQPAGYDSRRSAWWELLHGIWPVMVIVVCVLFFQWDVGLTVIAVIGLLLIINRYQRPELKTLWQESFKISLIILIVGILFFKEMLITTGLVTWLPEFLKSFGIPEFLVVCSVTFIVGFSVGISQGYVAATFPLLIGIIGSGNAVQPGMLILAYVSGFAGVMLTPLHLCLLLTVEHFKANIFRFYQQLMLPQSLMWVAAFIAAFLWK